MRTVPLERSRPIDDSIHETDKDILEVLPVAVLLVGQEGSISYANPQAEELLGTRATVLMEIGLFGVVLPHCNLFSLVDQVRLNGQTMIEHAVEVNLLRANKWYVVDARASPLGSDPDLVVLSLTVCNAGVLPAEEVVNPDAVDNELLGSASLTFGQNKDATPRAKALPADDNLGLAVARHLNEYFAAHVNELPPDGLYGRILREIERPLLTISLSATGGNQLQTAKMLGLNRNTLRKKIRDLNIRVMRGIKLDFSNDA